MARMERKHIHFPRKKNLYDQPRTVTWEVRINDNVELTAQRTNLNSTDFAFVSISSNISTESSSEFQEC